jgi:hypothetical protein
VADILLGSAVVTLTLLTFIGKLINYLSILYPSLKTRDAPDNDLAGYPV